MASPPYTTPTEGVATRPSVLNPPGGTWQGSNEMDTSRGDNAYWEDDESDDDNTSPKNHVKRALLRGSSDGAIVVRSRNGRAGSSLLSPNSRVGPTSQGFRRSPTSADATHTGGSTRPTRAESKRHSWAARQQQEVIPEEPSPVLHGGAPGINRALSLDSGITGRNRQPPPNSARTPTGMRNGHASPGALEDAPYNYQHHQHYQQPPPYDYHDVSSNGELQQSPGDMAPTTPITPTVLPTCTPSDKPEEDMMDICHDPSTHSDRAKYITDRGKHAGNGCSGCRASPSCSACDCCSPGRPLHNFCSNLFRRGKCSCKQKSDDSELDEDIYIEDDPFRKRCLRAFLNFVYVLLAFIAVIVTYSMIQDLITAMNNPVRSIHYKKLKDYEAPGISMYPGGAKFLACGHYYNNVVTSKVRTSDLDLVNRNCTYTRLNYDDPHYIGVRRDVLVVRGPTSFEKREAIFLHFELEDETRDFFTVSYFVFPGWDKFNASTVPEQIDQLTEYHRYMPTFALSSGLRMWIKLIMSETYLMDDTKHTEFRVEKKEESKHTDFNVEYSVVKFWDRRLEKFRKKHLFFIFFEWKNNIVEQSYLIYTTTPWSIGAGLCGVFLTLHRGYQLAQIGYKRARKDKERRSIRKRTIRELKKAKSMDRQDGKSKVNRKLKQQLSS